MADGVRYVAPTPGRTALVDIRWVGQTIIASCVGACAGLLPWLLSDALSYIVTLAIGLTLVAVIRQLGGAVVYLGALLIASAVAQSNLIESSGRQLPTLALAIPLFIDVGRNAWTHRQRITWPPGLLLGSAAAYLGLSTLSVAAVTLGGVRATYPILLLGLTVLGLGLGLVVLPTIATTTALRRRFFVVLAALGPIVLLSDIVLFVVKPFQWAGNWVGTWIFAELTLFGRPTGIVLPRATGPYEQPFGAASVLAVSVIALIALRPGLSRRGRTTATALSLIVALGLFATWNRDGWLIVAGGATLIAAFELLRRRHADWLAISHAVGFLVLLVAITVNVIGANIRQDIARDVYGAADASHAFANSVDVGAQIRGGSGLSGRQYLWSASLDAIRAKPVFGWGIGGDQAAISGYLPSGGQYLAGFTSDSMWLLTAVERGFVGLLGLLMFCAAAMFVMVRRFVPGPAADLDMISLACAASFSALLIAATFETFLLGGLTFPSIQLAMTAGLATTVTSRSSGTLPAAARSATADTAAAA